MPQTYRRWPTQAEAHAFRDGVEHVNDSALTVVDVYDDTHPTTPWVVLMEDADASDADDPDGDLPDDDANPTTP